MEARKKLLAAAATLFHEKGYNSTGIQDILDASSVFRNSFYYHFDSKEQLGFEVLGRRMLWWYERVFGPSLDNFGLRPAERVEAMLDRILSIGRSTESERGCPFGNLAQEMSCINEPFREALSDFFRNVATGLEQCFEDGKRTGDFREDLPSKEIAEFAIAAIQGSFLLRKTHRNPQIMESNIRMLRQMLNGWK